MAQSCLTHCDPWTIYSPWNSPGQNTGVDEKKVKSESEVVQSCPTLCNPVECSPPGSSVHGILQARILEWVAISFFRGSSRPKDQAWVSCIAGIFFYHLRTPREAPLQTSLNVIPSMISKCLERFASSVAPQSPAWFHFELYSAFS